MGRKRKLVAAAVPVKVTKKQKQAQDWSVDNIASATGAFLDASLASVREEYNEANACVIGDAGRFIVGLPCPSLSFEYVIQNTCFPLGRVTQVVGLAGCCKSAFCFEVVRWCRQHCKGIGVLFENERKYSSDFALSILGYDDPKSLGYIPCSSMEDWQSKMQSWIGLAKKKMTGNKESPGSGRIWPAVLILDSLMGSLSQDTVKSIEKAGYAERRFAIEAMKVTDFLKKVPVDFDNWPFLLLVVNHLKKSQDAQGNPVRGRAGGKLVEFQETFEFELSRLKQKPIKYADRTELHLNLQCFKNSLGEMRRNTDINVQYWTEEDPETGISRQRTVWDWHGSTISLLLTLDEPGMSRKIKEIVDLQKVTGPKGTAVWSKTLGISQKAPVPFFEAGQLLDQTPAVKDALREVFGIKSRKIFQPGIDYLEQLGMSEVAARTAINHATQIEIPAAEQTAVRLKQERRRRLLDAVDDELEPVVRQRTQFSTVAED